MSVEIHGHCDERFLPFKEAFRANFDEGLELGASLGVTYRGKMVVDLWGGFADRETLAAGHTRHPVLDHEDIGRVGASAPHRSQKD
jgi:hypothetical protein